MATTHIPTGVYTGGGIGHWPNIMNQFFSEGDTAEEFPLYTQALHNIDSLSQRNEDLFPFELEPDQAEELNFRWRSIEITGDETMSGIYDRTSIIGNPNSPRSEEDLIAYPGVANISMPIAPEAIQYLLTIGFPLQFQVQSDEPGVSRIMPNGKSYEIPCAPFLNGFLGGSTTRDGISNPAAALFFEGKEYPHFRMEWLPNTSPFASHLYSTYGGWSFGSSVRSKDTGARIRVYDYRGRRWKGEAKVYCYFNGTPPFPPNPANMEIRGKTWWTWGGAWNAQTGFPATAATNNALNPSQL